jgi:hypothetical protein
MPSRRALLRTLGLGTVATAGSNGLTDPLDGSSEEPTRSVGEQFRPTTAVPSASHTRWSARRS